jgi:hypothetical protein
MIIDPKGKVLAETHSAGSGYCVADFSTDALNGIYQSKMAWFNHFKRVQFLNNACTKTSLDKKCSNSRLAKSEKCEFTLVNDHFEDKHNAEVELFLQDQKKFYD